MAQNNELTHVSNAEVEKPAELVEAMFTKLKEFGSTDELYRLFPNGLDTVNLEVTISKDQQKEFRLTIKGAGTQARPKILLNGESDDDAELSFNAQGHRVVAYIAMKDLATNLPDVKNKVQKILDDGDRSFLEAAVFPDVIRDQQPETKIFHFVDISLQEGGPDSPPLPNPPHVITKIQDFTEFLKNGNGGIREKVDALSWLFHLFGDVHQPLHCIERKSALHPQGDRGGNLFKLTGKAKNLHSAWDSCVNVLSPGKDEEVLALEIMEEHSRIDLQADLEVTDTEKWARSSFNLAKKHAYSLKEDPQNPPKPSIAYLKNMEMIGRRQVALAGYRLANKFREIFE